MVLTQERKSDDPNRPYDLSLDLERGGRGKATSASIFDSPTVSTAEGEVPSDMELLMAEFVRLDVGSEEINAAISQVLDDGKEGNSGMLAIYNVLVWGMQRCGFVYKHSLCSTASGASCWQMHLAIERGLCTSHKRTTISVGTLLSDDTFAVTNVHVCGS